MKEKNAKEKSKKNDMCEKAAILWPMLRVNSAPDRTKKPPQKNKTKQNKRRAITGVGACRQKMRHRFNGARRLSLDE